MQSPGRCSPEQVDMQNTVLTASGREAWLPQDKKKNMYALWSPGGAQDESARQMAPKKKKKVILVEKDTQ